VVYTTNGSIPTPKSAVYRSPIALPNGGTINAACIGADGEIGMMASTLFSGFAPAGWKVISQNDASENASNAIDASASTLWETSDSSSPHVITVDMGRDLEIGGFSYLPRQDKNLAGVIQEYSVETSADGTTWTTNINKQQFDNIKNNPIQQEVHFPAVTARYFRFTAYKDVNGTNLASAAEISVLPANAND
jgi:alpha-L-fucosidase